MQEHFLLTHVHRLSSEMVACLTVKTISPMIPHFLCLSFTLTEPPNSRNDLLYFKRNSVLSQRKIGPVRKHISLVMTGETLLCLLLLISRGSFCNVPISLQGSIKYFWFRFTTGRLRNTFNLTKENDTHTEHFLTDLHTKQTELVHNLVQEAAQ